MSILKTSAIPFYFTDVSNTSRIVTWLTADYGKLSTIIKGEQRKNSLFRGQYDLFSTSELVFYDRTERGIHIAKECSMLYRRPAFRTDWRACAGAGYISALFAKTSLRHGHEPERFELFEEMLSYAEDYGNNPVFLVWFDLKFAEFMGHGLQLEEQGTGNRDRRSETGGQRSEVRGRRSEIGDRRSEIGDRRSEAGGQRPEVGDRRSETGGRRSEVGDRRSETGDQRPEVGDRRSETGDQRSEVGGQRSEVGDRRSEAGGRKSPQRAYRFAADHGGLVDPGYASKYRIPATPLAPESVQLLKRWQQADSPEAALAVPYSPAHLIQIERVLGKFAEHHYDLPPHVRKTASATLHAAP